jgi:pimeloyl-ACP methyl ester carboxylesterase
LSFIHQCGLGVYTRILLDNNKSHYAFIYRLKYYTLKYSSMSSRKPSISSLAFCITIAFILVIVNSVSINGIDPSKTALAQQPQPQANLTSVEQQQLMDGISFEIDNVTFSHHTASVNGIQLHYVIGGHGDPVVLLHGWPETWYAWHKVMPALAKNHTVIVPDLRGLGDSSKPPTGYDGKTVAEDIHQLVTQLGFKSIFLVGHDIGVFVAYPYAAAHPTEVEGLAVWEAPVPGFFVPGRPPLWWVLFHQTPDVPEALVQGKEMTYLSWFYQHLAYDPAAITQEAINEYVSHYSAPGGMRAGFEYYRAIPQDAMQNQNYSKTNLTMPVLTLQGGYIPVFGGNITMSTIEYGMKQLAQNVTAITVPNSGHFIAEEQPDVVVKLLNNFFSGNSTTSSG